MTEKTVNTNTAPAQAGAYLVHQARRRARYALVFFVLIAAFCLITVLNINIGNIPIPLERIVEILFTKTGNPTEVNIIWKIRLPRHRYLSDSRHQSHSVQCHIIYTSPDGGLVLHI